MSINQSNFNIWIRSGELYQRFKIYQIKWIHQLFS
jgi:hypothetical protein